jgi:hypothetical protein
MQAAGEVATLEIGRSLIKASTAQEVYKPQ